MTAASIFLNGRVIPVDFPARTRRYADLHHVSNVRPSNVTVQRPGGPLYNWADDADLNDDLTPPYGVVRPRPAAGVAATGDGADIPALDAPPAPAAPNHEGGVA